MVQALFEQLSTQLNFLLLSQRNMIIVSAFSVALATFSHNTRNANFKWLSLMLFVYSVAVGITAAVDFNILKMGCKNNSRALKLAKKSRKKHGYGKRKTPQVKL